MAWELKGVSLYLWNQTKTNVRKIWNGWVDWAIDMKWNFYNWMDKPWRIDHLANATVTTSIVKPYRTWAICFWIWVGFKVFG